MAKHPTVGEVKTRLGEFIGYEEAAGLYMCFLRDTVEKVIGLGFPLFVYYTPDDELEGFKKFLGEDITYVAQNGHDLGERLYNGFIESKRLGYGSAIALASDVPDLPESVLVEAGEKLEEYESIIGPCPDGGYYLIGLREDVVSRKLFQGITWSTETVLAETLRRVRAEKIRCYSLEQWYDVDEIDDLKRLMKSSDTEFHGSSTWNYLRNLKLPVPLV